MSTQSTYTFPDEELRTALQAAEAQCAYLAQQIPGIVFTLDEGGMITSINEAVAQYGYQVDKLMGQSMRFLIAAADRDNLTDVLAEAITRRQNCSGRLPFRLIARDAAVHRLVCDYIVRFGRQGQFAFMLGICNTAPPVAESRPIKLSPVSHLEEQALIRNAELFMANEELYQEILERRETERKLREREAELELEKANLEETNTALRVLLKRRESDKHEFEDQVMHNVRELILPFMDRLKAVTIDERQHAYLCILESNLNDITSAFSRRISLEFYNLTVSERRVANFIRQGKRSREIAALLGLSLRTIDAYRLNIRKKLRILNKRVNLRTFLMSLS
jgi:hypothetical protein